MPLSRRDFIRAAGVAMALPRLGRGIPAGGPARPSAAQLAWQRDELAMFLHFGVNTFTDREWGLGNEDPAIFDPTALDARQWARTARSAGFRAMILTAKHHDGFCLWPTATTKHSVASSPFRGGQGDVVREFTDACRAEGLKAGLYLSPWDRNAPVYGDSPAYNDLYIAQLTELLTRYGPIAEVWFDGANGEGPNGRKQAYDWPRIWGTVRRLQPSAVIFSDAGPDIRWIGNEDGSAGDPDWSPVDPTVVPYPGAEGAAVTAMLQHGDPHGTVWRPGETDVSIRPGWFNHPAEDAQVKSADRLVQIWLQSVGRNSKLLLNVPPTREGLLHPTDAAHLDRFHRAVREALADDFAAGRRVSWAVTAPRSATAEVDLGATHAVGLIRLGEPIEQGQRVARYRMEGWDRSAWRELSRGETIGYCKLDRCAPGPVSRLRLTVEDAVAAPLPVRIGAFAALAAEGHGP